MDAIPRFIKKLRIRLGIGDINENMMIAANKIVIFQKIVERHSPSSLVNRLGFYESLHAADAFVCNQAQDPKLRECGVAMLELLRRRYSEIWTSNWRYDAYLGYAHDLVPNYFSRFAAYIRALIKTSPPPPRLLIEIARCCYAPEDPPLTQVEATFLLKRTMSSELYVEGVELLIRLYKDLGNTQEWETWTRILNEQKNTMTSIPSLNYLPGTEEEWAPPPDLLLS